ncbi:hypothetical protein ACFOGI_07125 [Virgibacillus xinjiangensis]|uniref:SPOR domain-containing protein n=1 Tax=Virgibacillus xinjiangensis TaxID=393090 RepID=A0ABV7CUI7_9BACI
MDRERKVEMKKEGNRISFKLSDPAKEQQAAVIEDQDEEPVLTPTAPQKKKKKTAGRKVSGYNLFKPVLMAGISAVLIGSVLGFVMLRMIAGIDADGTDDGTAFVGAGVTENEEEQKGHAPTPLQGLQAFVVQGGVFGNRVNAEEWAEKFSSAGMPQVIWQKDGQYFLFAGIAADEDTASQLSSDMADYQLESFVKEWQTTEPEVELTNGEAAWVRKFVEQWNSSLEGLTNTSAVDIQGWEELLETFPSESEELLPMKEEIASQKDGIEQGGKGTQESLLHMWLQYEQTVSQ